MNKKISRLLEPGMSLYFLIMILFTAATALLGLYTEFIGLYYMAIAEGAVTVALYIYSRVISMKKRRQILKYIESTTYNVDAASKDSMLYMPFPMAVIRLGGNEIIWNNDRFLQMTDGREHIFEMQIGDIIPDFPTRWLIDGKSQCPDEIPVGTKKYHVFGNVARSTEDGRSLLLATLYWIDMTEFLNLRDEYQLSRPIATIILIDNYDELMNNLSDTAKSGLLAAVDDRINHWTNGTGGLLRKLERDRYLFVFEARYMNQLLATKFSILDSIREVVSPTGIAATISIGIGKDGGTYEENMKFASLSIEMALSRGGDQAVLKDRFNFSFYGGRTKEAERRTKVKSRVVANSLSELIGESSQIFVMGHKNADIDSVGAAAGIQCICRKKGKKAGIVIDLQHNAADTLIEKLRVLPEYSGCFISAQDALLSADSKSLLIIVDTNRPDQVESEELLLSCNRLAVIDHHRRAADYIQNVTLNFHEPFASSASELVAELLQYAVEQHDILRLEAEALLAGIVLDTKNFSVRTGSRTFDAAAFLRRTGADTVDVKKLFQNDLDATIKRYRIIQTARLYREEIAICALDKEVSRTIAAQAADELLNISGILTSFVLYPEDQRVVVSARSIGDANVQMILEPLGGGGNAATAGAQVPGKTVNEVLAQLVTSIDKYYDEEE